MVPGKEILNELKTLSTLLAGMDKVNIFTVPDKYFVHLPTHIISSIKKTVTPSVYTVPEGYFDTLADTILARVKSEIPVATADELKELSPVLYNIQRKNIWELPKKYFDDFPENMLKKVSSETSKVLVMQKRRNVVVRYAIAAALAGVMALGVFKLTNKNGTNVDATVNMGLQIARENSFEEELAKVNNTDIIQYLENNGENIDVASVTNIIDDKQLPDQEDYLIDEKALDNYLNSITSPSEN